MVILFQDILESKLEYRVSRLICTLGSPIWWTLYCWFNLGPFLITQACSQIEHGIMALFGPSDLLLGTHVQSLCDALDIPHLEARYSVSFENCQFIELDEKNWSKFTYFQEWFWKHFSRIFPQLTSLPRLDEPSIPRYDEILELDQGSHFIRRWFWFGETSRFGSNTIYQKFGIVHKTNHAWELSNGFGRN